MVDAGDGAYRASVYHGGVSCKFAVPDADSSLAVGHRSEFLNAEPVRLLRGHLRLERTAADAGRERLEDHDDVVDLGGSDAVVSRDLRRGRVLAGYVRIRSEIERDSESLRSFEEDGLASVDCVVEHLSGVDDILLKFGDVLCLSCRSVDTCDVCGSASRSRRSYLL